MHDLPWNEALIRTIGGILIAGGVVAFLVDMVRSEKKRKRSPGDFDARVGRDVYCDIKGIHR